MNARSQIFELTVEGRQIDEVVSAIFHSLLLHRTLGKLTYKQQDNYSLGTVGTVDVDCDFVDFTYVRVESEELNAAVHKEVTAFRDALRTMDDGCGGVHGVNGGGGGHGGNSSGQISLEFFQRKKGTWPFSSDSIPWEVWILKLNVVTFANEHERLIGQKQLHDVLTDKIMYIAEAMSRHEYVPKMPNSEDLETVFFTGYSDVQPYLHKITFSTMEPSQTSMTTTVRKLLKDTLAL
jgi:autophagy-related protein 101